MWRRFPSYILVWLLSSVVISRLHPLGFPVSAQTTGRQVIWDTFVDSKEQAVLQLKRTKADYPLSAPSRRISLQSADVTLVLEWEVLSITGAVIRRTSDVDRPRVRLPADYCRSPQAPCRWKRLKSIASSAVGGGDDEPAKDEL